MSHTPLSLLQNEWLTLQTQFDSYEKCSLAIKLFNVLLFTLSLIALRPTVWVLVICAVVWLQDGIWKTFQSRIGKRLEVIEHSIKCCATESSSQDISKQSFDVTHLPMQFNSAWEESRPGSIGLVAEYIKNAMKPTVAYPHIILITLIIAQVYVV